MSSAQLRAPAWADCSYRATDDGAKGFGRSAGMLRINAENGALLATAAAAMQSQNAMADDCRTHLAVLPTVVSALPRPPMRRPYLDS